MAAFISWVCRADHAPPQGRGKDPAAVTIYERSWAFCVAGGREGHSWEAIEPTAVEQLRAAREPHQMLSEEPAARRAG